MFSFISQGQNQFSGHRSPGQGQGGDQGENKDKRGKKDRNRPLPTPSRGRRHRKGKGPDAASKLPTVTPHTRCRLKLLKLERIHDWLLMEEEFLKNSKAAAKTTVDNDDENDERSRVDDLRGNCVQILF